ncbi:MAG: M14 family metallopeptidase [Parabacteroides sp.]|nr:M14 family metallopeptidase [Parabacteroides sp.]
MAIELEKIKSWDGQSGTGADNRGVIDRNFEKVKGELEGNKAEIVQLAGDSDKIDAGIIEALFPDTSSYEPGYIPLGDFSVGQQLLYDVASPTSDNLHTIIDVKKNDKFAITGNGGTRPRLYGFVDSANILLYISSTDLNIQNLIITAPEDGKLILNSIGYVVPKLLKLKDNRIQTTLAELIEKTTTSFGFERGRIDTFTGIPTEPPYDNLVIRTRPIYFSGNIGDNISFSYTHVVEVEPRNAYCYFGDKPVKAASTLEGFSFGNGEFKFKADGTFDNIRFALTSPNGFTEQDLQQYRVYNVFEATTFSQFNNQVAGLPLETVKYIAVEIPEIGSVVTYEPIATLGMHLVTEVKAGDKFILTGRGLQGPRLYAFVDTNDIVLERADSIQESVDLIVVAKQDGKLIFNTGRPTFTLGDKTYNASIAKFGTFFDDVRREIKEIKEKVAGLPLETVKDIAVAIPEIGSVVTYEPIATLGMHLVTEVKAGDKFILTGRGLQGPRLYAFVDTNDIVLERADSIQESVDLIVVAKQDGKLIFNTSGTTVTLGDKTYNSYIAKFGTFFDDVRREIKEIKEEVAGIPRVVAPFYSSFNTGVFESNMVYPDMPHLVDPTNRVSDIINGYDALLSLHPSYVTKQHLGNEVSGLPIYRYDFTPISLENRGRQRKRLKYIIIAGIHGSEPVSYVNVLHTMQNICNNWKDDKALEFLRFNVDFIVIPLMNPYGALFDTRRNANFVDLNRNWLEDWQFNPDTSDITYAGTEPLSELETQYVNQIFIDNSDASAIIDCHNYRMPSSIQEENFLWCEAPDILTSQVCDEYGYRMLSSWAKKYNYITPDTNISRVTGSGPGGRTAKQGRLYGIPISCTYEVADGIVLNPESANYDSQAITLAYEAFVNFLLQVSDTLTQRGNVY